MVPGMGRSAGASARPLLVWVGGADNAVPPDCSRVVEFDQRLFIGRHPPDEGEPDQRSWVVHDRLLSSEHAEISEVVGAWVFCVLESRNDSVVDAVSAQPRLKLRDGSMIFVGSQVAIFHMITDAERAAIFEELKDPVGPVPTCNPAFAMLCSMLRKLAPTDCESLQTGETASSKENNAHAIHRLSGRQGKLVAINCAAVPRELVESELFGYLRGAHSQANASKPGIIEEAEGGTLFLDEIGDMAPELQTKLLRFTQDRMLTPLGVTRAKRVDVRNKTTTNHTTTPQSG